MGDVLTMGRYTNLRTGYLYIYLYQLALVKEYVIALTQKLHTKFTGLDWATDSGVSSCCHDDRQPTPSVHESVL